jgi:outer membrane protein OmpA-like peptidoglycan-associated protein
MSLGTWGCATKKHVAQAIAPVQQQVNTVQQQAQKNTQSIGDLDRQVAQADEKATDAGKKASDAANAAQQANSAAQQAGSAAQQANSAAQQAQQGVTGLGQRFDQTVANLDNYQMLTSKQVFFRSGQSTLSKEAKEALDNIAQSLGTSHNIVIEVEGFTDRTGGKAYNLALAQRRADAVVRYLTVDHNIPLRYVRELGVGSEFPNANNKTRAARKENRRVDVKVYSLNLPGMNASNTTGQMNTTTPGGTATSDQTGGAVGTSSQTGTTAMPTVTQQGNMPANTATGTSDRSRAPSTTTPSTATPPAHTNPPQQ